MEKENFAQQFSPVEYTINVKGQLLDLSKPCVMGILNVTPDSFYADSRMQTEAEIYNRTNQIIAEGAKNYRCWCMFYTSWKQICRRSRRKTPTCYGTSYNS